MQTIRIWHKDGGFVASFTGPAYSVETPQLRAQYPETQFIWLR